MMRRRRLARVLNATAPTRVFTRRDREDSQSARSSANTHEHSAEDDAPTTDFDASSSHASSQASLPPVRAAPRNTRVVEIVWPEKAARPPVVATSHDSWMHHRMIAEHGTHGYTVSLTVPIDAPVTYKFLVDGSWRTDPDVASGHLLSPDLKTHVIPALHADAAADIPKVLQHSRSDLGLHPRYRAPPPTRLRGSSGALAAIPARALPAHAAAPEPAHADRPKPSAPRTAAYAAPAPSEPSSADTLEEFRSGAAVLRAFSFSADAGQPSGAVAPASTGKNRRPRGLGQHSTTDPPCSDAVARRSLLMRVATAHKRKHKGAATDRHAVERVQCADHVVGDPTARPDHAANNSTDTPRAPAANKENHVRALNVADLENSVDLPHKKQAALLSAPSASSEDRDADARQLHAVGAKNTPRKSRRPALGPTRSSGRALQKVVVSGPMRVDEPDGPQHVHQTAQNWRDMAKHLNEDLKDPAGAHQLLLKATEHREKHGLWSTFENAQTHIDIARLQSKQNEFVDAEFHLRIALRIYEQVDALPEHTADLIHYIAVVVDRQRRRVEAEKLYKQALDLYKEHALTGHNVDIAIRNLTLNMKKQSRALDADTFVREFYAADTA